MQSARVAGWVGSDPSLNNRLFCRPRKFKNFRVVWSAPSLGRFGLAERVSGAPKWNEPAWAAAGVAAGQRRAGGLFDGARRIFLRAQPATRADPGADRPDLRHRRLPAAISSGRAARGHRAPG